MANGMVYGIEVDGKSFGKFYEEMDKNNALIWEHIRSSHPNTVSMLMVDAERNTIWYSLHEDDESVREMVGESIHFYIENIVFS
jgi:hypothetical protein